MSGGRGRRGLIGRDGRRALHVRRGGASRRVTCLGLLLLNTAGVVLAPFLVRGVPFFALEAVFQFLDLGGASVDEYAVASANVGAARGGADEVAVGAMNAQDLNTLISEPQVEQVLTAQPMFRAHPEIDHGVPFGTGAAAPDSRPRPAW